MKRRIFGLENEYGLTCTLNGQRRLSPDNVARYLFEKVIPGARNANVFLENGARLYLDTGFHPEYATPECDDVTELVIHDKAGERIVEDLLHEAENRLREDGISGNILLFKNNTDSAGNSYGCHENYLVSRDVSFQRLAEALHADFNSEVKKGQLLAKLDQSILQAQLEQQTASVRTAEATLNDTLASIATTRANLEKAKVDVLDKSRKLKRTKELFDDKLVPRDDLDTA